MVKSSDELAEELRCVEWTNDGKYLVCGAVKGVIYSLDAESLMQLSE